MAGPTREFWQQRFESGQTPWDRGCAHPQLLHWIEVGLIQRGQRVLVPGCGRGHEVIALAQAGIEVLGLDYAPAAVDIARQTLASQHLNGCVELADVLTWRPDADLDLIYEQTCLCALHPDHWLRYSQQLFDWLKPGGLLLALVMQAQRDSARQGVIEGPPYHVDINAMRALFPAELWEWPRPPHAEIPHGQGWSELAVVLRRR